MICLRKILTGNALVTIHLSATVHEAVERMVSERVGAVLVVDESGHPCGIFSERDLMKRVVVGGEDPRAVMVRDKMTHNLYCAHPDQRVAETSRKMRKRHIRHLPVVEDDVVIGLLSIRDLLYAHLNESEGEVEALTTYIQGGVVVPSKTE